MMKQRTGIFVTFGVAMACLVVAAIAMAWIKMDFAHCNEDGSGCKLGDGVTPAIVTGVFALFFVALVRKHQRHAVPQRADQILDLCVADKARIREAVRPTVANWRGRAANARRGPAVRGGA